MSVRVLITGSRHFTDRALIAAALSQVAREHPGERLVVVHGDARGADRIAAAIAADFPDRLEAEAHPAPWRRADGSCDRSAGHRRNQQMVDAGAAVCLAFLHAPSAPNRGTESCVAKAVTAGIPVRSFTQA